MARKASSSHLGYHLSNAEIIAGWLWLPFYLVLLSPLIQYVLKLLTIDCTQITLNLIYFVINLAVVLLIFRRFLRQRFFGSGFWNFVQAIILGFVLYYACTRLISFAVTKLAGDFTIYNNETVAALISENRYVMLAVSVIFAPVIEETLIRGLVFGSLHSTSRILAYFMSCLIFVLMHNWQYFGLYPAMNILLSCLPYIPAAIALGWTYEKAGTIWAPITLHALINAMSYGLLSL